MKFDRQTKNILFATLVGFIVICITIIVINFKKSDNYDSEEHTIAANGCSNLKNNYYSKMAKLDKCGNLNTTCIDPTSLKKLCPTTMNIYLLHDSKDIDRTEINRFIWAIIDVQMFSKDDWNKNLSTLKTQGWVPCGKNFGTIPGIYPEPLNTNGTSDPVAYLAVKYAKVDFTSPTPILTSILASHFSSGKSTCVGHEVQTNGNLPKNLISGNTSYKTTCAAIGGCTTFQEAQTCNKYVSTIMLNYVENNKGVELSRYISTRSMDNPSSYIGIMLSFPSSTIKAVDWKFKTNNPNAPILSFGDILALAGDLYGIPTEPITPPRAPKNLQDEKRRFLNCFNTLKENTGDELKKIMQLFATDMKKINEYLIEGKLVSDFYHSLGFSNDIEYNKITGGGSDKIPTIFNDSVAGLSFKGRYISLAQNNYDHFCEKDHAYRAYLAGHTVAMEMAAEAKNKSDDLLLNNAYAMEAFSCHFLSDHFSSGHIRVPREDLHFGKKCSFWNSEYNWFSTAGDYCSKLMHDEDNKLGLMVANNACYEDNPDPSICKVWRAYGDSYMTEPQNQENLKRQQEVLQISVDEVWKSYLNGLPVSCKVWFYLPCIDERAKIPKLDDSGRIIGYYPNNDIYNDTAFKKSVKIGECSSLNHTPMFLAPDPTIYGADYNCLYKRVGESKMTYIFSPAMAVADFKTSGDYFPGVTHGE